MNTQFLIDTAGHKTAVVLPIEDYRALLDYLEELEDLRLINERQTEPRIAIDSAETLHALLETENQPKRGQRPARPA